MGRNSETKIQNDVLRALSLRSDVLIWRNQVGKFRALDDPRRIVSVGTRGSADIVGIKKIDIHEGLIGSQIAVAFAIEIKTETGRLSAIQDRWRQAWSQRCGAYSVSRSVEHAEDFIQSIGR